MTSSAEFKESYAAKTPTSRKLSERACRILPAGVVANVKYFAPYPLFMQRAGGSHLWDVDGNEYIDYCLAFGPLSSAMGTRLWSTLWRSRLRHWVRRFWHAERAGDPLR